MATKRAEWAQKLLAALDLPDKKPGEYLVVPIWKNSKLIACLGWFETGIKCPATRLRSNLADAKAWFRQAYELEQSHAETQALHWLLQRSDRPCAVGRHDGEMLGATVAARDLFHEMRFGLRHYFRSDAPSLPPMLVKSLDKSPAGQVVLGPHCTARFERLPLNEGSWTQMIGVECFTEIQSNSPPPLSRLTAVERDIWSYLATGATNREIARIRGTSFSTIKNQVSGILQKMGVSRRIHLLKPPSILQEVTQNKIEFPLRRPRFTSSEQTVGWQRKGL